MKIKLLHKDAVIPKKATPDSAGYDLYLPEDVYIKSGRNVIPLGFAIELPKGYVADIRPRSGFSVKGMDSPTGRKDADVIIGTVDADYRLSVGVIIKSEEKYPFMLQKGTRAAQMVIHKYEDVSFEVANELSETKRDGGFGSTGTR